MSATPQIAEAYPLSPLQRGILFESLYQPEHGAYLEQFLCMLEGELDVTAFNRAWEHLADRYTVLRTAFIVKGQKDPIQAVMSKVNLHLTEMDWSGLAHADLETVRNEFLREDRAKGFSFNRPPLFRLMLARIGPGSWQFVWTHHHILMDGWSHPILMADLLAIYNLLCAGKPLQLGPVVPYRDYIEALTRESRQTAAAYWRETFAGFEGATPLGITSTPGGTPGEQERLDIALSQEETENLNSLAKLCQSTVNTLFQAAWALVLSRYSGSQDVTFGVTVSGRSGSLPGIGTIVGLLINTLPLRIRVSADITFSNWLDEIAGSMRQILNFESSDLIDIREWSGVPRGEPLFESVLAFENFPFPSALDSGSGGFRITGTRLIEKTSLPLTLIVVPGAETELRIAFDTSRITSDRVAALASHLRYVLRQACENPERPLASIALQAEPPACIVYQNGGEATLDRLFRQSVATYSECVALTDGDRSWTYAQLDQAAERFGSRLPGAHRYIGVLLEKSAEQIIAMLAIVKTGSAYVPLDPAYPRDRLRYMISDSGCSAVVTLGALAEAVGSACPCLLFNETQDGTPSEPGPDVHPESAAYVIYTSGSTGRPKGVVVTHRNVARLFSGASAHFAFAASDVWTYFHSFSFDFSVWELWGALLHGARVVIVRPALSRDTPAFYELLSSEQVTVLSQTPSAFRMLIAHERERTQLLPLALRYVVFGGEALDFPVLRDWFAAHPDGSPEVVNMYGITETTVHVTYCRVRTEDLDRGSQIGKPLPDLDVILLDRFGNSVPQDLPGEMGVGGAGLARGYLNLPALTAERFRPHPFRPGERLYLSGDLARQLAGEDLEYVGRIDQQVKIRGHRIELGEVNTALEEHSQVRQAFTRLLPSENGTRLAAYIACTEPIPTEDLRAHLATRLPAYMVPEAFLFCPTIPLTLNGKVDLRALPLPDTRRAVLAAEFAVPRNEAERVLAEIWQTVLGVDRVGIQDNYFALGGDSIRSLRVVSMARERGLSVTLQELFQAQTIAAIAPQFEQQTANSVETLPFQMISEEDREGLPADVEDAYPLGRLQAGMLFHSDFGDGENLYLDTFSFRLQGVLDETKWRRAVAQSIAAHPVLRTSFDLDNYREPLQLVHRTAEPELEWIDLRATGEAGEIDRWRKQALTRGFNWGRPALFRIAVHRLEDSVAEFSVMVHHAILDGWSVATLLKEWSHGPSLPQPVSAFRDFIALEQQALQSAEQRNFWHTELADAEPTSIDPWPQPRKEPGHGKWQRQFPDTLSQQIAKFARLHRLPLKTVFLAAHLRVLEELAGEAHVTTGLVSNGRPETGDSDRVLGLFLNTLPFQWSSPGGSWVAFCEAVLQKESALLPYRRFPLAEMLKGRGPAFEVSFNFVHFHILEGFSRTSGLRILETTSQEEVELPLAVNFSAGADDEAFLLGILYDRARYSEEQVAFIGNQIERVLEAMAAQPDAPHRSFSALSNRHAFDALNATELPVVNLVPELVAQAARLHPERHAVVVGSQAFSYGELDLRSSQVAQFLTDAGVEPEEPVAIKMERSFEMVIAILGIWRAGGCFVPIEPDLPAERQEVILQESGARHCLTEESVRALPEVSVERSIALVAGQLAYILFTSGSTGKPKGVAVTHRGLANEIQWLDKTYPLNDQDRVLQKTPFGFDASVWEFWFPLSVGATLVMADPGVHRDSAALLMEVQRHHITVLQVVPSLLDVLLEEPGLRSCTSLRLLFCGGEALKTKSAAAFQKVLPIPVVNLYGPTEATIQSSAQLFDSEETGVTVSIGPPLDNNRYYVLNLWGEPVERGCAGELYIGGTALARGYYHQPVLTGERFLPDPFSAVPGSRVYRTGDKVRWLPDGKLEYMGRLDQQVKVRGARVELSEVESALTGIAGVTGSAVILQDGQLRAFVSAAAGPQDILRQLQQTLPPYMTPSSLTVLTTWPLLASGKINRSALARIPVTAAPRATVQPPSTETEHLLFGVWSSLLPTADFGVDHHFFELGGDSILTLQMVARARRAGFTLTPKQVFANPTIRELAALAQSDTEPAAVRTTWEGRVPLAPAQAAFFAQRFPNPHHWNQSVLLGVRGPVDPSMIREKLESVLSRHDALWLHFSLQGSEWVQQYDKFGFVWEERECRPGQLEAICSEAQRGLDITHGPLFRALFLHLSEGEKRLLLVAHHLIVDGVSWRVLLEQISASTPAPQTASFGEWSRSLPAFPPVVLHHVPDNRNTEGSAETEHLEVPAALLKEAPAQLKMTVAEMLLAALAVAISEWSGKPSVRLTLETNGRDAGGGLDVSSTVGWLTALHSLELDVMPCAAISEQLFHLKPQMRGATKPGFAPSEVSFNYLGQFDATFPEHSSFVPAQESAGEQYDPRSPRAHLLDFIALQSGGEFRLQLRYSRNLHDQPTASKLLSRIAAALREMAFCAGTSSSDAWSPSDFPLSQLTGTEFAQFRDSLSSLSDILPLSPVQQGMLFHSLEAGAQSGVYVQQLVAELEGDCDSTRLQGAWQRLIERHPQLRASFVATASGKTVAVTPRLAHIRLTELDWTIAPDGEQRLDKWLAEDRRNGFHLTQPPLMRLALIRMPGNRATLIWTSHHLILDGWSIPLILAEVLNLYAGQEQSKRPGLAWSDYLRWLASREQAGEESFWRNYLRNVPETQAITGKAHPDDSPSSTVKTWSQHFTSELVEFARRKHVTLNTLVQAAWSLVVGRNLRMDDVVIGSTFSGRPAELTGSTDAIGMFINTLPVRISLAPGQRVSQWLEHVQASLQSVLEYQHSRLVDVHRWSGQPAGHSLFESIVVFENYPLDALRGNSTGTLNIRHIHSLEQNHYPLSLYVAPAEQLKCSLLFQTPRLSPEQAESLLAQLGRVLEALPTSENLGEIALAGNLPPDPWQASAEPTLFLSRFSAVAAAHANRIAVRFGTSELTYRELDQLVTHRAAQLKAAGACREQIIAIRLERSLEMIVSVLAVMRTGAAYLPIDPRFPPSRIASMLEIARPLLVIDQSLVLPPGTDYTLPPIDPDQLAYVIFTSGSTGTPNGVQITHRALANLLDAFEHRPGLTHTDTLLAVTTLSFDIATLEILLPLMTGATLHVASTEEASDGVLLARVLRESKATVMQATPVTWRMLIASGFEAPAGFRAWCGGEALPTDLAQQLINLNIELWNVYGPTETTIWSSCGRVRNVQDTQTLGDPIQQTRFYILDQAGNRLPPGVVGELWIAGSGLTRGYRDNPALTAERLVPNTFSGIPGSRLYRTGDLGRQSESGQIEFLGRVDLQIKLDGHRIETGDIEAALRSLAGIQEAAVVLTLDSHGRKRLIGYVVPVIGFDPKPAELQWELAAKLPPYMVPVSWMTLTELPLTPNKKVDRQALPEIGAVIPEFVHVTPRNMLEEALTEVWKEIFDLPKIGVTDNFFDLGGHSLIATQIHARLIRIFQTELSLRELFHNLTIESIANMLQQREVSPGRALKIAAMYLKVKRMSPEEKATALAAKARTA